MPVVMFYNNWSQKPKLGEEFVIYSFRAEIVEGVIVVGFGFMGFGIIFARSL